VPESKPIAEPKSEEVPEVAPKKASSLGKIAMIIVIALVSSAGGGVVSWFLITKTLMKAEAKGGEHAEEPVKSEAEKKAEEVAEALEKGAALQLEPFVVNLADEGVARYLRIKVSLMVDDKNKAKEVEENTALQQKVRDVILQTLTKKSSKDLIDEHGKATLREEIHQGISGYFKEPKLVDVMFTEFVIQL
jgi:flagellar basal body-associated protein FliL